jgi:hypothetical protein
LSQSTPDSMKKSIENSETKALEILKGVKFSEHISHFLNYANRYGYGTRDDVVGFTSNMIREYEPTSLEEWKKKHLLKYRNWRSKARKRIKSKLNEYSQIINSIDDKIIDDWIEDLVYLKTYQGYRIEKLIRLHLGREYNAYTRKPTVDEEKKGIDGYVGECPISVKPKGYPRKNLKENLNGVLILYELKSGVLTYEYDHNDLKRLL